MKQVPESKNPHVGNQSLFKLGGIAAWLISALTLSEVILFIIFPQPDSMIGWFQLFQKNWAIGLIDFWGCEILMYILFVPVFLALYFALNKSNESWSILALVIALLGTGIFLATNLPFSMLSLSHQYAAAAIDSQKSALLAAGEALLASTGQRAVGGFNLGLFLVSVAGLIFSMVMLQGSTYRRYTAILGMLAFALSLADYLRQALTGSIVITLLIILPNVLFLVIWFILVGFGLFRLGRNLV